MKYEQCERCNVRGVCGTPAHPDPCENEQQAHASLEEQDAYKRELDSYRHDQSTATRGYESWDV